MAARIGFTFEELRRMQRGACNGDVRLGWKDGDPTIIGLKFADGTWVNIPVSGTREIELLMLQLRAHLTQMAHRNPDTEVVF